MDLSHRPYEKERKLHVRQTYPNCVTYDGFLKRIKRWWDNPNNIIKSIYTKKTNDKRVNLWKWNKWIKKMREQSDKKVWLKAVYKRINKWMDINSAINNDKM